MPTTPPPRSTFAEPSTRSASPEWSPDLIRAAEALAEAGDFRIAADLADAIAPDDQVKGALTTLVGALLGLPLEFEVGGSKRRGRRVVRALEAEEDWWACFPETELTRLVSNAVLLGMGYGTIRWSTDPDTDRVIGRIETWPGRHLRQDKKLGWVTRVGDDREEVVIRPDDPRWLIYAPGGGRRPYLDGAWRSVARWWLLKRYAVADWGVYGEARAQGVMAATQQLPSGTAGAVLPAAQKDTAAARKELASDLQNLGRRSAVVLPPGFDVKLVEATANTWQTFKAQIEAADRGIVLALHGTNLTNEDGGSYAKALVLQGVHIQVVRSLAASLATTLHDQHLVYWAEYNFGDRKLAPWPAWQVTPPADLKGKADALGAVAQACVTLAGLSDEIDVRAILEEHGVAMRSEEDLAARRAAARKAPSKDEGEEAPSEEDGGKARPGEKGLVGAAGREGRSPAPPARRPLVGANERLDPAHAAERAALERRARAGDTRALAAILLDMAAHDRLAGSELRAAATKDDKAAGYVRGQHYADDVADEARDRATELVVEDVDAIGALVAEAKDLKGLRAELLRAYRSMSAEQLAELTQMAIEQSQLAGRLSLHEDVHGE